MKLDALGITVSDMNRSVAFYKLLGLRFDQYQTGEDHTEATTSSGLRVMLDSEILMKKLRPNWQRPVGQRMTMAFHFESPQAVDEAYAQILAAGHSGELAPWDAFWGQRYATVKDPDGNCIDLFAPLAAQS